MISSFLRRWTMAWTWRFGTAPASAIALAGTGLVIAILAGAALALSQIESATPDAAIRSVIGLAAVSALAVASLIALLVRQAHEREARIAAERAQAAALAAEKTMLEAIASSSSPGVLETICRAMEAQLPGGLCSILLLDADRRHLRHGAAPNLPREYVGLIDGVEIGPNVGSCGTAAHLDRRVIVADIQSDPLWIDYSEVAARFGLRACWSTPIHNSSGTVLGTFAIYYREPRAPTPTELDWSERATHLAGIAIERQQADHAMTDAKQEAERANRAKSAFLANMSHELRTPLNAIIGFSEGLEAGIFGPLADAQHGYLRDIGDAGRHLLALINDLLDLSRIETGRLQIDDELVDMAPMIAECAEFLAGAATAANVTLTVEAPADLPRLRADRARVRQIVSNLLSNAIKFSPGGRVRIGAELRGDGALALLVADSGIGMAAAEIDLVLEPFRQGDGSHARQHAGAGLGLPLTKQLVALHGGSLDIESTPGAGTTVHAVFPAARVARVPFRPGTLAAGSV